jgi:hypothetical protein
MRSGKLPSKYKEQWITGLDNRTALARIVNERLNSLESDLGGSDRLSYQQRSLAKRAIWMEAIIEQQEAALSRGEDVDQGKLTQAVNSLIGLFAKLGLERIAHDVPTLHEYMQKRSVL